MTFEPGHPLVAAAAARQYKAQQAHAAQKTPIERAQAALESVIHAEMIDSGGCDIADIANTKVVLTKPDREYVLEVIEPYPGSNYHMGARLRLNNQGTCRDVHGRQTDDKTTYTTEFKSSTLADIIQTFNNTMNEHNKIDASALLGKGIT